jgi:tetratricopeptide (TPR) repeat protein
MTGIPTSTWRLIGLGLVAFVVGFVLFRGLRGRGEDDLIATYFAPFAVPNSAMPEDGALNWIQGVQRYNQQDYVGARAAWRQALSLGEQPDFLLYFYLGECAMALADYPAARDAFAQVLDTRNDIHPLARWHLALAGLAMGDAASARPHLQILVEDGNYRAHDAQVLLDRK